MSINLITDPWLPVRQLSGKRSVVRPADITLSFADDPILALDFPRPDWNAAVTEMLIGFLACVMAPEDDKQWADLWTEPPSPDELHAKLMPLAFAFNLGGEGPRCFQDMGPLDRAKLWPIRCLFLDGPGENTEEENRDFFFKRSALSALSFPDAAAALITTQTYATGVGSGHRAGLRKRGPVSTLVLLSSIAARGNATLWSRLWTNVPDRNWVGTVPTVDRTDSFCPDWGFIFPWLRPTRSSEDETPTTPEQGHILQCFFSTPHRIRLELPVACESGEIRGFSRQSHGALYKGWIHPLSSYKPDNKEGKVCIEVPRHAPTYHDWFGWIGGAESVDRAHCLRISEARINVLRRRCKLPLQHLDYFFCGFSMGKEQAKVLNWMECSAPYYGPPDEGPKNWPKLFIYLARLLVTGAEKAAVIMREYAIVANFGKWDDKKKRWSVEPRTKKKAHLDLLETFWRETETDFLHALKTLRNDGVEPAVTQRVREDFLKALRRKALLLFDAAARPDDLADQDARRIVDARARLGFAFGETGDVRAALNLISAEAQQKIAKRKAKRKEVAT